MSRRKRVRTAWVPKPEEEAWRLVCAHCGARLRVDEFVVAEVRQGLRVRCSHPCLTGCDLEGSGHAVRGATMSESTRERYG